MTAKPHSIHEVVASSDPKIERGQVWCRRCGNTFKVDPAECLRNGWPRCCGATMTIDSPEERS
jgi:Zn finger protein HypA/HybF involved in hydrogenase expression